MIVKVSLELSSLVILVKCRASKETQLLTNRETLTSLILDRPSDVMTEAAKLHRLPLKRHSSLEVCDAKEGCRQTVCAVFLSLVTKSMVRNNIICNYKELLQFSS